jgi:hypothetical protein
MGRFTGLILDFAGVLTSNMVEVYGRFEERENLPSGLVLRGWADPRGQDLYRRLELGEISQAEWNEGFGVDHPEFGGDSILPKPSGLGWAVSHGTRRLTEPQA